MLLVVYCDGAARGNPGPAAWAFIVKDQSKKTLFKKAKFLGRATNNEAEYQAVIGALEFLSSNQFSPKEGVRNKKDWKLDLRLDSQLVVEQLSGRFKVKDARMRDYFFKVRTLENNFFSVVYHWIKRNKNNEADFLVNSTIDEHLKWN
jgi:ribonuclease HI